MQPLVGGLKLRIWVLPLLTGLVIVARCRSEEAGDREIEPRKSNVDSVFLGAYLRFPDLFRGARSIEARERAIDEALEQFQASGLDVVMPYVTSTSGMADYPSEVIASHIHGDWDPVDYLVRKAHARKLEVYPVVCVMACGKDRPGGILREHPEWALRQPDGTPTGYICATNPQARDWVTRLIAEVVRRYPTKGILLDYLRYHNRPTRLDAASESRLAALKQKAAGGSHDQLTQRFKEDGLTALARQISETVRKLRPNLQIAIYSWGPHVAQNHQVAQNWPVWSRAGYVDMVNISGYCYPDNYGANYLEVFENRIRDAIELNRKAHGKADITFCLGVSTSHGEIQAASWVHDYLSRAAALGVSGTAFFRFASLRPFLAEIDKQQYIPQFRSQLSR